MPEEPQIWKGCPKCGELRYRSATLHIDRNTEGKIIKIYHDSVVFNNILYAYSKNWQDQWYRCSKCNHIYDRKEGLVNEQK